MCRIYLTTTLETARGHLMLPQVHVCNGLVHCAGESMLARAWTRPPCGWVHFRANIDSYAEHELACAASET